MEFSERMAAKLKEARSRARVSAAEAAQAVNRSDKTIYAWENNKSEPSAEQLIELCKLYDVDIAYFYLDDDQVYTEDGSLTSDESELLRAYRRMGKTGRRALLTIAKDLAKELGTAD